MDWPLSLKISSESGWKKDEGRKHAHAHARGSWQLLFEETDQEAQTRLVPIPIGAPVGTLPITVADPQALAHFPAMAEFHNLLVFDHR